MNALKTLGITIRQDIPLTELLGEHFNPHQYDLTKKQAEKVTALRDIIVTYGKEASRITKNKSITRASQAVTMANHLRLLEHEELWIAFLNRANRLISMEKITEGDTRQCLSSTKLIISKALSKNASALIMFHNHPSGTAQPSESDLKVTTNIRKACGIMEISLLDHIVISMNQYYSMTEEMTHFFED